MFGSEKARRPEARPARRRAASAIVRVESLEGRLALSGVGMAHHPSQAAMVEHLAASHARSDTAGPIHARKTYSVSSVASFQELVGNYAASDLARVRGAQFYLTNNGATGNLTMPNTWFGTMSGNLSRVPGYSNIYQFSAVKTLNTGVALNVAYVQVSIAVDAHGTPTAMALLSRAGNNVSAVVNNTGFGSSVSSAYAAVVTLA